LVAFADDVAIVSTSVIPYILEERVGRPWFLLATGCTTTGSSLWQKNEVHRFYEEEGLE